MIKKKQLNTLLLLGVILFLAGIILPQHKTQAGFGFGNAFGGRVTLKLPCDCDGGTSSQITIQGSGQSSGTYLDSGTARAYKYFSISPGRRILGKYTSGGACLYTVPDGCVDRGITKGTITMFGVSF